MSAKPVTVVVRLKAKSGMESLVREELYSLLAPTCAERGCLNFDMHEAPDDPSLFMFHENWVSEEDLTRHFQSPHITRWIGLAEKLLGEPLDLTKWRRVE